MLYAGLKKVKVSAGVGLGNIESAIPKCATGAAKNKLVDILRDIEKLVAVPRQASLTLGVFLGKPSGGDRIIGILSLLFRLLGKCRSGTVGEWRKAKAGFWDTAVAGSSSLRAAVKRSMCSEIHRCKGWAQVDALVDIEKFYDDVSLCLLGDAALRLKYPPLPFTLGLMAHLGPRVLMLDGAYSEVLFPYTSLVAGDWQAPEAARCVLYGVMELAHRRASFNEFASGDLSRRLNSCAFSDVDDIFQSTSGPRAGDVVARAVDVLVECVHALKLRRFKVADKSVIISRPASLAKSVVRKLNFFGITVKAERQGRDLGVDTAAGNRRATAIGNKRVQ
jgi:hypothetical protein